MQLSCPQCGTQIPAEHINIQQMVAVCPNCDTVFEFKPPQSKSKIRKIKQPDKLALHDTDTRLTMAFRTNFRLDRDEAFLTSGGLSLFFTFVTAIITQDMLMDGNFNPLVTLAFGTLALVMYYWLALTVFNKTHIELDDEAITIARKPLTNPLSSQPNVINLAGVAAIRNEETTVSKIENYDTPRYRIWAEMADGRQKIIVNDVTEDYAFFITQCLNERLEDAGATDVDVSRLLDKQGDHDTADDLTVMDNLQTPSQANQQ